jgi:hypothetical protein
MTREAISWVIDLCNTQGVRAINVADDDRVASVERMRDGKLPAEEVVP